MALVKNTQCSAKTQLFSKHVLCIYRIDVEKYVQSECQINVSKTFLMVFSLGGFHGRVAHWFLSEVFLQATCSEFIRFRHKSYFPQKNKNYIIR